MKILIVCKYSKLEWDLKQDPSFDKSKLPNLERIEQAHKHQVEMRSLFREEFPSADFIFLDEFHNNPTIVRRYDLIISLGGDNSFTNITHHVGDIPILGVCLDPERSTGSINSWRLNTVNDIKMLSKKLWSCDFDIEDWTRLSPIIDHKIRCWSAISEIFIGEKFRWNMSRYDLSYITEIKCFEQKNIKSSGLLLATGTGYTGWLEKAANPFKTSVARTSPRYAICNTEAFNSSDRELQVIGVPLTVKTHSRDAVLSIDAWATYKLTPGSSITVEIGKPLQVLVPRRD